MEFIKIFDVYPVDEYAVSPCFREKVLNRPYSFWTCFGEIIPENSINAIQSPHDEYHNVVPMVSFDAYEDNIIYKYRAEMFVPGTIFKVRDLEFQIVTTKTAICLSTIGTSCFGELSDDFWDTELSETLADWCDYYLTKACIDENSIVKKIIFKRKEIK